MSYLFTPLGAKTKAMISLFSNRSPLSSPSVLSSRHLARCLLYHGLGVVKTAHPHLSAALFHSHHQRRQYSSKPKTSDPLHILFCGSDEFSCASLKALHDEQAQNPDLIRSIDVVVRPGKRMGRGLKIVRHPPIRSLATSLGLLIHERDTFTGWDMPEKINLIIAVSFGLLVPPRLLHKAKYGGLNIHPSLLPDLRGPAPLQYALLTGRTLTGVSLQTLHEKAFDHGVVLAQTPSDPQDGNALHIPASTTTVAALQALVTPAATDLLIQGLRKSLHVPPHEEQGWRPGPESLSRLTHAPKITTQDKKLTLSLLRTVDAESSIPTPSAQTNHGTLRRRQDAIGPLWFHTRTKEGKAKRIIIQDLKEIPDLSPANRPSMLTTLTNTNTNTNTEPQRTYKIPFLESEEEEVNDATTNLVLYDPIGAPERVPGQPARGDSGEVYLGNYCISSLKVDGEKAKPAWSVLHQFLID
ncbi:formyl transferase [Xylaria nigripes]|nr:formyl transferase [Xylaria nigripes]